MSTTGTRTPARSLEERAALTAAAPATTAHLMAHAVHRTRKLDDACPLCYRYGSGKPDTAREVALGSPGFVR